MGDFLSEEHLARWALLGDGGLAVPPPLIALVDRVAQAILIAVRQDREMRHVVATTDKAVENQVKPEDQKP